MYSTFCWERESGDSSDSVATLLILDVPVPRCTTLRIMYRTALVTKCGPPAPPRAVSAPVYGVSSPSTKLGQIWWPLFSLSLGLPRSRSHTH